MGDGRACRSRPGREGRLDPPARQRAAMVRISPGDPPGHPMAQGPSFASAAQGPLFVGRYLRSRGGQCARGRGGRDHPALLPSRPDRPSQHPRHFQERASRFDPQPSRVRSRRTRRSRARPDPRRRAPGQRRGPLEDEDRGADRPGTALDPGDTIPNFRRQSLSDQPPDRFGTGRLRIGAALDPPRRSFPVIPGLTRDP